MNLQDKLSHISSYTSKLLRKKFGRGPESCHATIGKEFLLIYIRGFISPMEDILIKKGQISYVDHAREVIISHVMDELKGVVQVTLDVTVEEYFHDWSFSNNSGIIGLVFEEANVAPAHIPSFNIGELEGEVSRLTSLVQKTPDAISTYPLSPHIVLVERIGILIPIEKALIQKGFRTELKLTKSDLEKGYLHHQSDFTKIFNTQVLDIFIDWDFDVDKSMLCFILK